MVCSQLLTDMLLYGYKVEVETCYVWHADVQNKLADPDADTGLAGYIAHCIEHMF